VIPSLKRALVEVAQVAVSAAVCVALYAGYKFLFGPENFDYIRTATAKLSGWPRVFVGCKLSVRDESIAAHGSGLVVIVSPDCRFCSASAPFYRRLVAEAQYSMPILVALPVAAKGRRYASSLGFKNQRLLDWKDLGSIATGTPTVALIRDDGTVLNTWIGQLGEREEADVFNRIKHPNRNGGAPAPSGLSLLGWKEVRQLMSNEPVQIISISQRDEFAARDYPVPVIDIPSDEIPALAPVKLREEGLHVLDCSAVPERICQIRISQFNALGFRTIGMYNWIDN
jgi:hypothetical protein